MIIPQPLLLAFSFLLGASIGSFLNVCIYRIPIEGLSIARPRGSFCPGCKTPIGFRDNIPLLSWLLLGGRCRGCSTSISVRYPFVELLTALLFMVVVLRLGPGEGEMIDLTIGATLLAGWAIIATLVVISWIDIDHQIIPDSLSIGGTSVALWLGLVLTRFPISSEIPFTEPSLGVSAVDVPWVGSFLIAVILGAIALFAFWRWVPDWQGKRRTLRSCSLAFHIGATVGLLAGVALLETGALGNPALLRLQGALAGMVVGSGVIWIIGRLGSIAFGKEAMGFGDVKLMAFLGALLGPSLILAALLLACLVGSVIGLGIRWSTGSSYIPFGPFLCLGAATLILALPEMEGLWRMYLGLLGS